MNIQHRLKRWFKLRFVILYPFGFFLIFFTNSDDRSIRACLWFVLTGLFVRSWANGYAIKSEKLTTSGPYAFVRHPLYLGSMFLAVGFIVMLKIYYTGALFLVVMAVVYYRKIKEEERKLEQQFKSSYIDYKKKVPAIVPSVFPYRNGEKWPFSFRRWVKSQEYKLFLWMVIIVITFHLKDELMVEHEKINARIIELIIAILILGAIDITGELLKWKKIEV